MTSGAVFLLSLAVILLAVMGMALGLLCRGRPLQPGGGCAADDTGAETACSHCALARQQYGSCGGTRRRDCFPFS